VNILFEEIHHDTDNRVFSYATFKIEGIVDTNMFDKFINSNFGVYNNNFKRVDNACYFKIYLSRLRYEIIPDNIKQIYKKGNDSLFNFKMFDKLLKHDTYYMCDL